MTIAHRSQYFHGVRIRNCVLEFSPDWSTSAALQRDCCVGIRDAHPRLVPIGASNQSITNTDSSGNRAFPVIVREQEFTFDFYWHELFRFSRSRTENQPGDAVPHGTQDGHASELTFGGQGDQKPLVRTPADQHTAPSARNWATAT